MSALALAEVSEIPTPHGPARVTRHDAPDARALLLLGAVAFLSMVTEGAVTDWSGVYLRGVAHGTAAQARDPRA